MLISRERGKWVMSDNWYKENDKDQVWWLDNSDEVRGIFIFSFDKKKQYNMFQDYPWKLTKEEKEIFDRENPHWAEFFKDRK